MSSLATKIVYAFRPILAGDLRGLWHPVRDRIRSDSIFFILRRDLSLEFEAPPTKIPLKIRPISPQDDLSFLETGETGMSSKDTSTRRVQIYLQKAGVQTCHLVFSPNGRLCYMQWLIPPSENTKLRSVFGDLVPPLKDDEAMLEGAYTTEEFRGQGIMAGAMALIAERAKTFGARWVITFVNEGNIASLKGCKKAGFAPYMLRHEKWRLFRKSVVFTRLPEGTPYPFDLENRLPQDGESPVKDKIYSPSST